MVLTIHPSVPAKTAQEFVAYARSKPGFLNFGSSGHASASHLTLEYFKLIAGVDISHVPYKGTAPLITDLLAGRIHGYFDVPITAYQNVDSGRLRALLAADTRRSPRMPAVPTSAEVGLPEFLFTTWLGLLAPSGVPSSTLSRISSDVAALSSKPEFVNWCDGRGLNALSCTPEEFAAFMRAETTKFAKIIKQANIRLE
jgi:tripartite-type tricarboxylate transporter receptor subunit TctC